jgi:O-antigen ligase
MRSDRPDMLPALGLWLAALAPLCWIPGGFSRFVLAKLLVSAVAVVAAALTTPRGALPRVVVLAGIGWAAVFTLAALAGDTPYASLVGRWPRYEGLPVLALYGATCWAGARVVGRDEAGRPSLSYAVGSLALALAAFSVLDISPLGPSTEQRTGSVLGNATDQGAVAMLAALVLAGPALRPGGLGSRARWYEVAGLTAAVTTVAISGSRTALGLTLLGLVVTVALQVRDNTSGRRAPGPGPAGGRSSLVALTRGSAALVGLVLLALAVPSTRERLLGLGTAEGRLHQWRLTLDLVLDHPLLGIGANRYVDAFPAYEDAAFVDFTGPQRLADSPHSVILQVLVAGGLLLLVATLVGVVVVVRRAREALLDHPHLRPAALTVAAYLALACVNFTTAGPTCLAAFLLGTVLSVGPEERERFRLQLPVAVVSAALAVVLAAACLGDRALQRGLDLADQRTVAGATDEFDRTIRWRAWDVAVRLIPARVLAEQAAAGDPGAAIGGEAFARAALSRVPGSYEALVALAVSLSAQGRLDEARETLDRAVAAAPQRPDAYVQRAIARAGLGEVDDALVDLRRAQEISPGSAVVRRLIRQVSAAAE